MRENLKKARQSAGLTQQQMADKLGIGLRHYQKIEADKLGIGLRHYQKIEAGDSGGSFDVCHHVQEENQ